MADITRLEQFLNHIAHPEDPIPAPQTRLEQNLVEIAENKDEAALPDYSEASDGDVLSIENGAPAWKAASGGGGGDVFVVTFSADESTMTLTADKTHAEITAALAANTPIIGTMSGVILNLNGTSGTAYEFIGINWAITQSMNKMYVSVLLVKDDDSVEIKYQKEYTLTPAT